MKTSRNSRNATGGNKNPTPFIEVQNLDDIANIIVPTNVAPVAAISGFREKNRPRSQAANNIADSIEKRNLMKFK